MSLGENHVIVLLHLLGSDFTSSNKFIHCITFGKRLSRSDLSNMWPTDLSGLKHAQLWACSFPRFSKSTLSNKMTEINVRKMELVV